MTRNDVLKISEPIETMYADCQAQLLINISKHFAGGYMPTAEWEAKMLSEMGALTRESVEIIAANTGQAPEAIRKAITEGMGLEIAETEKVLKGAAKAGKIQGAKESWQASPRVQGVVGSLTAQAKEDFNVVNTVMLESTRNRYAASIQYCREEEQKLIEKLMSASNAQELDNQLSTVQRALNASTASVAIGAEARTQAVRRTIKQLADQGITGYIDAGGHHWSPEAYINMDIRTTVHNAAIQGQQARSADYGVTTFQISTHAGARPLCEPYQGKFYSWDGTSGTVEDLSGKRYAYESIYETSYGEAAGIFGINCGHSPQTFVDGFSVPRYEPTQDEAKNAEEYALSQRQRYMEREIRQSKTEALCYDAAGDKEAFEKTAAKIKQQNANYKAFCSENGRTPRMDRTQVYGYNRSVSSKATQAAKNAEIKPFTPQVKTVKTDISAFKDAALNASDKYEFWMNFTEVQQAAFKASGLSLDELFDAVRTQTTVSEWKAPSAGSAESFAIKHDFSTQKLKYEKVKAKADGWMADATQDGVIRLREDGLGENWDFIITHEAGHQLANASPELQRIIIENPNNILGRYNTRLMAFDGVYGEYNPEEAFATSVSAFVRHPKEMKEKYPETYKAIENLFNASPSAREYVDRAVAKYKELFK